MKIVLAIFCVCMMTSLGAQTSALVGKTFKAQIGSSCEEVAGDATCDGKQIYMELYFEEELVNIIEVTVNGCGESTLEMIDFFPWHWAKDEHWTIVLGDLERTNHTIIENVRLTMRNDTLIAEKLNDDGKVLQEYRFCEGTTNYLNYEGC